MTTREKNLRLRRHARGFSLIELGIVIAVIAVLAAVVIFGRGFIAAGRISKLVEASNTIRKGAATMAGLQGGNFKTSVGSEIQRMAERDLLPKSAQTTWVVAGDPGSANAFQVTSIQFAVNPNTRQNVVGIRVSTPERVQAEDFLTAVRKDPNFVNTGFSVGQLPTCATDSSVPQGPEVVVCFNL